MRSVTNHCQQHYRDGLRNPSFKSKRRVSTAMNGETAAGARSNGSGKNNENGVLSAEHVVPPTQLHSNNQAEVGTTKRPRLAPSNDAGSVVAVPKKTSIPAPVATEHVQRPRNTGLEDLADKYTLGRILGEGTYGQVHRASDKQTGETVALKMIQTVGTNRVEYGFPEAVLREIKILRQLRFHVAKPHPNIIMLRNIVLHQQKENTICLVMDYMDIDLQLLLEHTNREIPQRVCQCYLYQLLEAINFVHENNIIHRDLKPSNIVVNAQHQLKVVDWGLARVFRNDRKIRYENSVCTAWWRSPELVLGADRTTDGYGPPIDMWSVGCIFVELLWRERGGRKLRRTPFDPRLAAPDQSGRLILPPGFTAKGPNHLTAPHNLWKVITGKLGIPTPADWADCDKLKNWAEFARLGLTNVSGTEHSDSGSGANNGANGSTASAQLGVAAKRAAFETELRLASMSPDAIDLALQLLELNPRKRIIARKAVSHRFFHGGVTNPTTKELVRGGAVSKPQDLERWTSLDKAHAEKIKKEAARKARELGGGGEDNMWQGSGGFDMLGEDAD